MIYFNVDRSYASPNRDYMVWFKNTVAPYFFPFEGSLNVIQARIFGLSYPDFLRYVRDTFGAKLGGRGHKYVGVFFPTEEAAMAYAKILDQRFGEIVKLCQLKVFDKT